MAASTRVRIMKGNGKSILKRNKNETDTKQTRVTRKKSSYKAKYKGTTRKKVVRYDSSSDDADDEPTKDSDEDEDMEEDNEEAPEKGSDSDDETKDNKGNEGWADVMTKILNSSKDKKSVILSRAQTDRETELKRALKKEDFEVEQADKEASGNVEGEAAADKKPKPQAVSFKEMKKKVLARREQKRCWESMGRTKPDITARQKERTLQRIATKGIVHLFNAVKQRQTTIDTKMKEVHGSEVKREKILKSMSKGDFLDALKSKAKSIPVENVMRSGNSKSSEFKSQTEAKPSWSVLCDDYMIGAKMKDWDKESVSDGEVQVIKTENAREHDTSFSEED